MEQLFATFYPKTRKIEPTIPRSQRYIISAQKKAQTANRSKRHQSFSANRQNTQTSSNYQGQLTYFAQNQNKMHSQTNFEDYILNKYEKQKSEQKYIHPFVQKKLQMRDINHAIESYKNFNENSSRSLQNDLDEQQNSSFFGVQPKTSKQHISREKLKIIVDQQERQNTSPKQKDQSKVINNYQSYGYQLPRYTELDEENNYSSYLSKNSAQQKENIRQQSIQNNFNNIQQNHSQHHRSENKPKSPNQKTKNTERDTSQSKNENLDDSFEDFYITLPLQQDINYQANNEYSKVCQIVKDQENKQLVIQSSPIKKQYENFEEYYDNQKNKEIKKSKQYPFFITKINILDQPNIYDVLSDKKISNQTEPRENTEIKQPNYFKGFIKHDIHYIQSKNLRAALSAASKKRQNTSQSSKRRDNSYQQITQTTDQISQPQYINTQISEKYQNEAENNQIFQKVKRFEKEFRKNTQTYYRDKIGYSDIKSGGDFNIMYENFQGQTAHNSFIKKARNFRITKSSQGQRNDSEEKLEGMNLLERLNCYNNDRANKYNLLMQNQVNMKQNLGIRNHSSQQNQKQNDSFSKASGTPLSQIQHSPSKQKNRLKTQDQSTEFNQCLTVQKYLKRVKTPNMQ
ncbi:hypothetical protein TTHERM_00780560 (macronuclear) [Tetrahymena thermophila SB210]|uniref:Uncharacterized protein n=1 Tax=Tetrahymena thermophila (strain SB210) TaxID=312017 RepID=I7MMM3_TETTS|nr:hypothetical protein TTHERM_00780560 [Tetrahymena thermophila SB210]EAS05967.3 hypothetical protein TTHERM_00780560 [Tetrahymena thermophila SB210]|eukprot:XP_001026212.3 hypothetical protein TTHERM_00780560 [Tetrahymena thermophila SB210]